CSSASDAFAAILITIAVLLLGKIFFEMPHGAGLDLSGLADDAAEDADETLGIQRAGVLVADPLQDLMFAPAVVDRQAGRFLDEGQLASHLGALVQQAQELGIEEVNFLASLVERRATVVSVLSHVGS